MKKLFLFMLVLAMALPMTASESSLSGDVNGDGELTIKDVTVLINYLLSGDSSLIVVENADVYPDGRISIDDVTGLINLLLSMPQDSHDWVDLGLPSGTLWATCNVGADSPEEYGDYFAWGETEPKGVYNWNTYKWCNGSDDTMTKYCTYMSSGYNSFVDNKIELEHDDDAATVNWGENWRMPSEEQMRELYNNCTLEWTAMNGVSGMLVTGSNGNTIFLPGAGYSADDSHISVGKWCCYFSRTLCPYNSVTAEELSYYQSGWGSVQSNYRYYGYTVRAVRAPGTKVFQLSETVVNLEVGESMTIDILNGSGSFSVEVGSGCVTADVVGKQLILTGVAVGSDNVIVADAATNATATLVVTVRAVDTNSHEWVDLGLPSGTLWATCNVGADSPEDYGDYFAWGETEPKDEYDWSNYKWCNGSYNTLTKYCIHSSLGYNGFCDYKRELEPDDDAATVNWGEDWRIPSQVQIQELYDNCSKMWTRISGVNGILVTGPNGNNLFLPAAGLYRNNLSELGFYGRYWSRTLLSGDSEYARTLDLGRDRWATNYRSPRQNGCSVRPVRVTLN